MDGGARGGPSRCYRAVCEHSLPPLLPWLCLILCEANKRETNAKMCSKKKKKSNITRYL